MKINAIGEYKPSYINYINRAKQKKSNDKNLVITEPIIQNKQSDISFQGTDRKTIADIKTFKKIERAFTPEARQLFKNAKLYAEKQGSKEVEMWHVYAAALVSLKEFAANLDNGTTKYDEEIRKRLPYGIEEYVSDVDSTAQFRDKRIRDKYVKVIDKHLKELPAKFKKPNAQNARSIFPVSIQPSKDTIEDLDLGFNYILQNSDLDEDTYLDSFFMSAINYSKDKKLVKESMGLVQDLREALMVDDSNKNEKNHLSVYDSKADVAWKNMSIGKNAIFTYDSDNNNSAKHFISSFVNLINKPDSSYKNIEPENTNVVVLNKDATFDFMNEYANNKRNSLSEKGKRTVIVADLTNLIKNSGGRILQEYLDNIKTGTTLKETKGGKVNYVFTMNSESYYLNAAKGTVMSPVFTDYAVQTIPSLNAGDTFKYLTDESGLKYVKNATGKELKPEVIQKAIEITTSQDGNYPDKAVKLLSDIARHYEGKEEISTEDVDKYVHDTKGLSEISTATKDVNVVFNTGKTLDDIVGSPMTKADARSVVEQIKHGIGVKGFRAFLEDGSSYGGGRKHTAEAIAGEAKIPMLTINAQEFAIKDIDTLSQSADFSEIKIRKIVDAAKAQAQANPDKTAMIFIENFDNFASDPLYGVSSIYEQKAFSQLLSEMENARKNDDINLVIVGSVNRPELIDENILKPYRFLNSILVYPPQDTKQRREVLDYYIAKDEDFKIEGDKEKQEKTLQYVSESTEGFTVVDLMYLLDVAKGVSAERGHEKISQADFTEAYLQTVTGRASTLDMEDADKKLVTSHEAGHAVTAQLMYDMAEQSDIPWHLPYKIAFITLDPRANYGGAVYYNKSKNNEMNFETVMADIISSYGGNSSESKIYNMNGSWGISGDMSSAEHMAELAVKYMGMGPRTGVRRLPMKPDGTPDVSEEKRILMEKDIDSFLKAGKTISDMIVEAYKPFILEFTEKYYSKVSTGDCLIPAEQFQKEMREWKEKQPEEKQSELKVLEAKIKLIMNKAKEGEEI